MIKFLLQSFLVLLSLASCWVIFTCFNDNKLLDQFSDDYISQINTSIKGATRNYLLPAQTIARQGSHMFREDIISLEDPKSLSTFTYPFINSYPQFRGYFIGTENSEFWFWRNEYSGEYAYRIQHIKMQPQGALIDYRHFYNDNNKQIKISNQRIADFDPVTRPWYQGAKTLGTAYWSDVYLYNQPNDPPPAVAGITASYPIYDRAGQFLGVWGVDILLKVLSEFLSGIAKSYNADLVIFNEQNKVIAYSRSDELKSSSESLPLSELDNSVIQSALISYRSHGFSEFFFKYNGERYLASYSPFLFGGDNDWYLLLILPELKFSEEIEFSHNLILLFATCVLLICLVILIRLFSQQVISTIKYIVQK
ncbi:cache domain-containing protein [Pseudoalteromonas sp. NBT06-2]|uniref:PDC sensor domain-containing protein n=1 Tax=Pseudoalteromonas sp. NBT06-2 TaxID=2025950 RepID=UPI001483B2E6|nr:cache domain-containing protein [Pseudoalteromonas sp. NBT06-2]